MLFNKQNYVVHLSCFDQFLLVGFEVLTAVVMKSSIFCDITPCSPFIVNRRFGGTYRLHLQGQIGCVRYSVKAGDNGGDMFLQNVG
jgi:hypothetical protein